MKRICIVIGTSNYASADLFNLPGCQRDARNIFDALTDPAIGENDKRSSILLISPTLLEMRGSLDRIFAENGDIDVFTFTFSGHGGVKRGNLFLCMQDTSIERLATTALPLSDLFIILNEAAPKQTNIIIDACESGGVVFDLRQLINPELLGARDTPGISILASSASDQSAKETADGGFASNSLLKCLRGDYRVQAHRPHLNLIEVGNIVSKTVSEAVSDQTPVVWGLNLFGDSYLAKNPHFEGDLPPYSYALARIPAHSPAGEVLQQESRRLWEIYEKLPDSTNFRALVDAINLPCEKLGKENGVVSSFIRGLSQTIPFRAAEQGDIFAEVQAHACCLVALLPFVGIDDEAEATLSELIVQLSDLLQSALENSCSMLAEDHFAILSSTGGTNDLFYVPLRLSKLLGWAAAHAYICDKIRSRERESLNILDKVADYAVKNYESCLVSVSDAQSPYLLCAFSELIKHSRNDEVEIIFGSYFNDYVESRGLIANAEIDPKRLPDFLLRRHAKNSKGAKNLYAQPDELLAVLMYVAGKMNMADVVDPYLEKIDHHIFNVFIATDHEQFGAFLIQNGVNTTFQIGYERGLGVFRTSDFRDSWENVCVPLLKAEPRANSDPLKMAVLLASFLFPNRVPWLSLHN